MRKTKRWKEKMKNVHFKSTVQPETRWQKFRGQVKWTQQSGKRRALFELHEAYTKEER